MGSDTDDEYSRHKKHKKHRKHKHQSGHQRDHHDKDERTRSRSRDRNSKKSRDNSRNNDHDISNVKSRKESRDRYSENAGHSSRHSSKSMHRKRSRDRSHDRSHDRSRYKPRDGSIKYSRDISGEIEKHQEISSDMNTNEAKFKFSGESKLAEPSENPVNEFVDSTGKEVDPEPDDDPDSPYIKDPVHAFDWDSQRYKLDRIFFTKDDYIKRNTQECDDFWAFLTKYTQYQKKKAGQDNANKVATKPREKPVDKHQRLNKHWEALYDKMVPQERVDRYGKSIGSEIPLHRAKQFRDMILYYWDFLDKQKKAKEDKIVSDQQNLPIYQYKQHIIQQVQANQVVVVAGDTGCGKSTQVPQYLLEAGFTKIACTQPRRIACISLARRVSHETFNEYGSEVAHQVRFEKTRTKATRILFLTEGLLLRQICSDPLLEQYSVLVIDEVHERHIHTDFLLGVVKCVLAQRSDLKLILMSATININLFSGYFDDCPVAKVPGRLYPIELEYKPLTIDEQGSKTERLDPAPYIRILQLIDHKYPVTERGDVLMFLSGMSEIMSVAETARAYAQKTKKWIILPLHSTLSVAEQDKVFDIAPDGVRKCIISTNIAETSVTIDGVRFVVDSGKVKEMSYDSQCKMQKLQEFWISRASAEQRKGRSGRTGPGKCFRLYAESDYDELQEYSTPEIHRVPLDTLILQMIAMGLPDARKFPYLENPEDTKIESSVTFLKDQGALTPDETLTPIGQMLSQLPVDIVIGKMLIMASIFQVVDPVSSIAACLSVQSPMTMKAHRDADAMNHRKDLESDHGDPITLLNAFDKWVMTKAEGQDTRKWCHRRGLEQQRFFEMTKLKRQFQDILQDNGLMDGGESDDPQNLTREERRQKNVHRKRLRDLKMEQRMKGKTRKFLKLEDEDFEVTSADTGDPDLPEDIDMDIKDLEFKLTHDLNKMQEKHNKSRSLTMREITLLKVILCSGLFPQVAIPDEHNSFKPDSEQMFHTKTKGFILLHPTSIFCQKPEMLELREHEVKDTGVSRSNGKGHLSNKHQLLAYVSILETLKPYLIGCLRVPALQILFLFSSSLDTNADCTRVLCDGWLELTFEGSEEAESVLSAAVKLRQTWVQLLELKLQVSNTNKASLELDHKLLRRCRKVQEVLSKKLTEFLHHDVYYYIRRVLTAELNHVYIGPGLVPEGGDGVENALGGLLSAGGQPHPRKGGVQVNHYLTYNCLVDEDESGYSSCLQKHWDCDQCGLSLVVTVAERLQHEQGCQSQQLSKDAKSKPTEEDKDAGLNGLRKAYHCDVCDTNYNYTTAEIFKHNRTCTS